MNIYERENSSFYWYEFEYNGKRHRGSTKIKAVDNLKPLAKSVASEEYLKVVQRDKLGALPQISLEDSCQMVVDSVSGKTKVSYELTMRKLLGLGKFHNIWSLPGTLLWTDLKQTHVDDHLAARKREGLSANSILIEVRFFQRVYNVVSRKYETNKLEFQKPKVKGKTRYLTQREIDGIAKRLQAKDTASYVKAYDLFVFLLNTGVRLGEALAVQWEDIDFHAGRIEIYRPKVNNTSFVPLADAVATRLEGTQRAEPFEAMNKAVKVLRKAIDEVCNTERNILRHGRATVHSLRDTFATTMLDRGMGIKQLSNLLGHSTIRMTEKYAHVKSDKVADEARRLLNG